MGATGWRQVKQTFNYLCEHQELQEYYRIDSILFVTKRTRQLQAADFIAYDLGRFFVDSAILVNVQWPSGKNLPLTLSYRGGVAIVTLDPEKSSHDQGYSNGSEMY